MHLNIHPTNMAAAVAVLVVSLTATGAYANPTASKPSQATTAKTSPTKKASHAKGHSKHTAKGHVPTTYKSSKRVQLSSKDIACLTKNVYYEARGEPYVGQLGVVQVTAKRVELRKWGSSVCNVVYAPEQFSWTANPKKRYHVPRNDEWFASERIVHDYAQGIRVKGLEDAAYFHTTRPQRPGWTRKLTMRMTVGKHVFYE